MSHDRDSSSSALPLSYKLVISISLLLMFVLGWFYLGMGNRDASATFQVYASQEVVSGLPAAFRVVQFNGEDNRNLPATIEAVALLRNGNEVARTAGGDSTPVLPADISVVVPPLEPGPLTVRLELAAWDGQKRTVDAEVQVVAPGESTRHLQLLAELQAPPKIKDARLSLTAAGGGLVDGAANRVWLRMGGVDGRPLSARPELRVDEAAPIVAEPVGRLGIAAADLVVKGPNADLVTEVPLGSGRVVWEEMVAPDRPARLRTARKVLAPVLPASVPVDLDSSLPEMELFCTLWHGGTASRFFRAATREYSARFTVELPSEGLYWITCEENFLSADEFPTYLPLLVTRDEVAAIDSLVAQTGDAWPLSWPRTADMTSEERAGALDYLSDRMAPQGLSIEQLVNTFASDREQLREQSGRHRDAVLAVMAMLGLGLLVWAVAVAVRQHSRLRRSFREFQDGEDVGDELATEGITRKRSFVPAILIGLTFLLNMIALLYLLRLIFL